MIQYDAAKQNIFGDKFTLKWIGLFYIHKKIGPKTVILRDIADPNKLSNPTSTDLLKHYKNRNLA